MILINDTPKAQIGLDVELGLESDLIWKTGSNSIVSGPVSVFLNDYTRTNYRLTGGLNINLWLNEWFGLNYEFYVGHDNLYGFHFNTGVGQVAAAYLLKSVSTELGATLVVVCMLVPEGVIFNIPINDKLYLQPYVNPLEIDYLHLDGKSLNWAAEAGVKLKYKISDNFSIRPKLGIRYMHSKKRLGATFGLGLVFDTK